MNTKKSYRPGVYSAYSIRNGGRIRGERYAFTCGSAKLRAGANLRAGNVIQISTISQLQTYFESSGGGEAFYSACSILLRNGVPGVYAVPITIDGAAASLEGYRTAFAALGEVKRSGIFLCQSGEAAILQEMKNCITQCGIHQREKVGVAAVTREAAIGLAGTLNSERILLCCQKASAERDGPQTGLIAAAELAGKLAAMAADAKLSGLVLDNLRQVEAVSEEELEGLLGGGVCVLEQGESGMTEWVRAVTTRTTTAGELDRTFSSINVVMMIDEIIQAVRGRLQAMLRGGSASGGVTLDSIASQVAVVLGEKQQQGLLVRFEPPVISQDSTDPQICLVEMEFHIAPVVSQIYLTAQIEL